MGLPIPDRSPALAALRDAGSRFTALLRRADDATRPAIGDWNVGEVAAHMSQLYALFPPMLRGEGSPVKDHLALDVYWGERLQQDPERDLKVLADRIDASREEFIEEAQQRDWTERVSWHGGIMVPRYSLNSFLLTEAELHGLDVARALKEPWGLSRKDALISIQGTLPVLPNFIDRSVSDQLNAVFELRLRGGPTVYLHLGNGELSLDDEPTPADVVVSADPAEYLLIGYGRKAQWGPILQGKILSWGRKPWLSLRFAKLFHSP
jgi:hypothetical protein